MVQHRTLPLLLVVLSFAASAAFAPPRPVARVVYHPLASAVIADQAVTTTSSTAKSPTTDADADSVTRPKGAQNAWEVHKFGGASLATADLYRTVGDLLIKEAAGRGGGGPIPTMAIVSARGGMTDLLVQVVDSALQDFELAQVALEEAVESQITLLKELAGPSITDSIEARFRQDGKDILSVVQSLRMLNTVPDGRLKPFSPICRHSRASFATGSMPETFSWSSATVPVWEKREPRPQAESHLFGASRPKKWNTGGKRMTV
jgi:hypothetical protein